MKLQLKKILKMGATASLLLSGLLAPNLASAVSIWIDDHTDTITAWTVHPANAGTLSIIQKDVNVLGQVDWQYNYISNDPNIPGFGQSLTYLYNIDDLTSGPEFPPGSLFVSNTLSVTVTGEFCWHSTCDGLVSVDLHFLSGDSAGLKDPIAFPIQPPLVLDECQGNPKCSSDRNGDPLWFQIGANVNGLKPLSDLNINISSASVPVPEPLSLTLMGIGLAALGARRRIA